ncbi:hypothetical protein V8E53_007974 [Lactarius tabidus]
MRGPEGGIGCSILQALHGDIRANEGWRRLYRVLGPNVAGNASSWGLYSIFPVRLTTRQIGHCRHFNTPSIFLRINLAYIYFLATLVHVPLTIMLHRGSHTGIFMRAAAVQVVHNVVLNSAIVTEILFCVFPGTSGRVGRHQRDDNVALFQDAERISYSSTCDAIHTKLRVS